MTLPDSWSRRRTISAGIAGNILEWYDFAVYGFFAPVIAQQFFPSDDPTVSLIAAFGAFAAGFLMRPVGGALFGHIGDRHGRARALKLSVLLMAVPTLLIGLLPTYETIGIAAAVLMVLLRMAQGLAVGGEYTSSVVFLAEGAPQHRRGLAASWSLFGAIGGILLGSCVGALLTGLFPVADLASWGWRVAFCAGISVSLVGVLLRRGLAGEAVTPRPAKAPLLVAARDHWRPMLRVCGLNLVNAIGFYLLFVYMVTWLVGSVKEPQSAAFDINTIAMASLLLFIPASAWASDRFGRKRMLMAGTAGMTLLTYPLLWLMHHPDPALILVGQIGLAAVLSLSLAAIPAAMTEMFPPQIRASAVSVSYNLTLGIFGGTAPLVAVWLIEHSGDDLSFGWYIVAAAAVSFVSAAGIRIGAADPQPLAVPAAE
jgi:MFS transporter, MHS family, proline/betaine transporter